MSTGPSRVASGTICRRKLRELSPKLSSTSPKSDCALSRASCAKTYKATGRTEDSKINSDKRQTMAQLGKVLHTAKTRTTGGRENGLSRSPDGRLDVRLSTPGAARIGANPEQLFAAGWSACFEGTMGLVAHREILLCRLTSPLMPKWIYAREMAVTFCGLASTSAYLVWSATLLKLLLMKRTRFVRIPKQHAATSTS